MYADLANHQDADWDASGPRAVEFLAEVCSSQRAWKTPKLLAEFVSKESHFDLRERHLQYYFEDCRFTAMVLERLQLSDEDGLKVLAEWLYKRRK